MNNGYLILLCAQAHTYRLLCGRGRSFLGAAEFLEIWSKSFWGRNVSGPGPHQPPKPHC